MHAETADIERTTRQVQSVTGLISVLGGLLAALVAFNQQLREAIELSAPFGLLGFGAVAAALLAIGLVLFAAGRRKGSRLLDPDALRLDPRRPEHLIGRSEEVRLLRERCEARQLVFLVGDSGSGKSALVQAGLLPVATADRRLLAVYLDMADLDWEAGPLAALTDRVWRCLSAEERKALDVERPPLPDALPGLLAACYPTLGRTPLIVLDQIDDYQLRHRDRFLPPATRSWLSASALVTANAFWAQLAELVGARHAHLLLVTRSDNADGLESLRLVPEPLVFRLDPLPPGFVLGVLDRLAERPPEAPPVVENPEKGWARLRLRLSDDLERSGAVLPQQLKVALMGLARLRPLSTVAYERAGGVEGLEARYIEDALSRAASRAGLTALAVRTAVMRLVEREGPRRGPPLPTAALAEDMADRDLAKLDAALEALEEADIIRKRELDGAAAWQLDHDYLARGILRVEADADRWKVLLARRAREFADARGSLRARWRARLSAREQIGFLVARLLGRFRYGEHRGFAFRSAAPYAAILAFLGLLAVGGSATVEVAKAEIAWTVITPDERLAPFEIRALAEIAQSGFIARAAFAYRLFSNPEYAMRASAKPDPIVRALVGLDEGRGAMLVDWLVAPRLRGGDIASGPAIAAILGSLPPRLQLRLPPPLPNALKRARAEGRPLDEVVLLHIAGHAPAREVADPKTTMALERLRASRREIGAGADADRAYTAGFLASSSQELSDERLSEVLATIREELRASRGHVPAISPLARAYASLARRLPHERRLQVIGDLIDELRAHRGNAEALNALAQAETVAVRGLPAELVQDAARALLVELRAARGDPTAVIPLAIAYAETAPASAGDRVAAAAIVLEELRTSRRAWPLVAWLAEAYAALSLPLPPDRARLAEAVTSVREALEGGWARDDIPRPAGLAPEEEEDRLRQFFEFCGLGECFALFAATVLDAAGVHSFDARAALVLELLKVPASTRVRLSEGLLVHLLADRGAGPAQLPDADLWAFVAWADARGMDPARPLDAERLLAALPR